MLPPRTQLTLKFGRTDGRTDEQTDGRRTTDDGRTDDGPTTDEKIPTKKFRRKNSDEKILTKKFRRNFFTSMSTSILRPCRPQLYVHVDLNYTSMSTSIIRPIRPQLYVQFDLNYTTVPCNNFFLPTVRSWGDMELPLATILGRPQLPQLTSPLGRSTNFCQHEGLPSTAGKFVLAKRCNW